MAQAKCLSNTPKRDLPGCCGRYLGAVRCRPICSSVVLLVVLGGVGCGGGASERSSEPTPSSAERVTVKLDTGAGRADDTGAVAPPDGGLEEGHGVDVILHAHGRAATVTGRVEPADSTVRILGPGGPAVAHSLGEGRFEARVSGLRRGVNYVRVRATSPKHKAWSREIRIVR